MIVPKERLKLSSIELEKRKTDVFIKTKLIPLHCRGFFIMNLTEIAQHHDEWVRIVKRFGAKTEAEDNVQDMYIRFHKYSKGQVITKSFIWIMLRNIFFDYCKREISMVDIDLMVDLSEDENNKTYEIELYYQSIEED